MAITLALGGGGARGLAHIGVLKVLNREQIPIKAIAGTSMGAIIGSAFAADIPLRDLEDLALGLRKLRTQIQLIDFKLSGTGLMGGTRIYRLLASMLGEERSFSDLSLPFAAVAVDLHSGREVVLKSGKLVDAIRATMSVPGVFAPVERGELLLADGGILNNVPVDVARDLGGGPVVAVDVLPNFPENKLGQPLVVKPIHSMLIPGQVQDLLHAFMIMLAEITEYKLSTCPAEVIIRPSLPQEVGLLEGFERAEELIAAGEAATEAALPKIMKAMQTAVFTT